MFVVGREVACREGAKTVDYFGLLPCPVLGREVQNSGWFFTQSLFSEHSHTTGGQ